MYTDRLPADRRGGTVSELTADEAATLSGKKGDITPAAARALEHLARAVKAGVGRGHLVTRRAEGSMLLELFTHAGVGTMVTAGAVEKLRAARIEDVRGILDDRALEEKAPGQAQRELLGPRSATSWLWLTTARSSLRAL